MTAAATSGPAAAQESRNASRRRRWVRYAVAVAMYAVALAVFFSGIVLQPAARLLGGYGLSDAADAVRTYDIAADAGRTPFTFRYDRLDGAPEGSSLVTQFHYAQPFQPTVVWTLRALVGSVAALNLFILGGILLTAIAGFALLDWAGLGLMPSLFGGFAIAFNPYVVERAMLGHVTFVHGWVLVLLLAALTKLRRARTVHWALAAGGAYALSFLVASYMGLLATALVLAFVIVELVATRHGVARTVGLAAVVLGVAVVAQIPGALAYAFDRGTVTAGLSHDVRTVEQYSASPVDYVVPVPRNPVFGWIADAAGRGSDVGVPEHRLFLGWAVVALAAIALVGLLRRRTRLPSVTHALAVLAAASVPVALALSFGRRLVVFGIAVPMPAFPITELTTFYRVYARFGYVVEMCLVVLAAVAVSMLLARGRRSRIGAAALMALAVVEFLPGHVDAQAIGRVPAYDAWLARQPAGIAAHYPLRTASAAAEVMGFREFYFQRFTRQPLFGSHSASLVRLRDAAVRLQASHLDDPVTVRILAAEGVRYVVVHDDVYRAQGDQPPVAGDGLRLLRRFGPVRVYRLAATPIDLDRYLRGHAAEIADQFGLPRPTVTLGDGFYPAERYPGFSVRFQWMTDDGTLVVANPESGTVSTRLEGYAFANAVPRRLELVSGSGAVVARVVVPTSMAKFSLGPFDVPGGTSTWTLRAVPGAARLGGTDTRRGSVYLSEPTPRRTVDLGEILPKAG